MRTLTGTLQTAQRGTARVPYVRCIVDDEPAEMPRFTWTSLYSGSEADGVNDAGLCADWSIARVRLAVSGTTNVYFQRVTDPTNAAQWASWYALTTNVSANGVCVQCDSGSGRVAVFYISPNGLKVLGKISTDYGVNWGAEETVWTAGAGTITGVGASGWYSDQNVVWAYDPGGVNPDDYLMVGKKVLGSWIAPVSDTQTYTAITGIGVTRGDDGVLQIVIASGSPSQLNTRMYNVLTSAFSGTTALLVPGSGSGFTYTYPKVEAPRSQVPRWFYTYVDDLAGVGKHTWISCTKDRDWAGEPVPVNVSTSFGLKLVWATTKWYLLGSRYAYSSPLYTGATGDVVDVGGSLRGLELVEKPSGKGSALVATLENSGGGYATAGQSGVNEPLREGSRVAVGLGYVTSVGNESVWAQPYWVEAVEYVDRKGEGDLELLCIDSWEYLDRLAITRQTTFASQTLHAILRRALWPACDVGATSLHGNLDLVVASFVWQPGYSYADMARRVLEMAGLGLRFKTTGSVGYGWDTVGVDVYQLGVGSASYSYGPSAHPVVSGRYGSGSQEINGVYVAGKTHQAMVFDWTDIELVDRLYLDRVVDKKLTTLAAVQARGDYELAQADRQDVTGKIEVAANVGQEVGDVVDITDSRAGLSGALRRVGAITTVYDRHRGKYDQKIVLTGR